MRDLRFNAAGMTRAATALSAYVEIKPETLERLKVLVDAVLTEAGAATDTPTHSLVNYFGMEPRSAVLLDLAIFGEKRSVQEIQDIIFAHGFQAKRTGQIRSSINATFNQAFFVVSGEKELVSLTKEGRS